MVAKLISFLFVLALGTAALANMQTETRTGASGKIEPGTIFGSNPGQIINGWTDQGGGLYPSRTFENGSAVERYKCCYSIFSKGDRFTIAVTEAAGRNETGGVLAERVIYSKEITTPSGSYQTDCSLLWLDPVLSFYDPATDLAISYLVVERDIREIRYVDVDDNCYQGD